MPTPPFRLCLLLTRALCQLSPLEVVAAAVRGGVDCVQLREKEQRRAEVHPWAVDLLALCQELQVPLVINDDVDLAMALPVQGLHLGQEDFPPEEARRLLPADCWIGLSTHHLDQLDDAADRGVDYAGFGPVHATATKGYTHGLGVDAVWQAALLARLPVVAIGGLRPQSAGQLPPTVGMAVSHAICAAENPEAAARAFRDRQQQP